MHPRQNSSPSTCTHNPTDFAEKLRRARLAAGLTQEGLSDLLGLSRTAVTQWETARCEPRRAALVPLAAALGLTLYELLDLETESNLTTVHVKFEAELIHQAWEVGIDVHATLNAFLHTLVNTTHGRNRRRQDPQPPHDPVTDIIIPHDVLPRTPRYIARGLDLGLPDPAAITEGSEP